MNLQSLGAVLKQTREVRGLSGFSVARAGGISTAYLSKLENDAVKKPSPNVLYHLSEALGLPYAELMRLCGYPLPGEPNQGRPDALDAALFGELTDDEREELVEYLSWYRTRRRSKSRVSSRS